MVLSSSLTSLQMLMTQGGESPELPSSEARIGQQHHPSQTCRTAGKNRKENLGEQELP